MSIPYSNDVEPNDYWAMSENGVESNEEESNRESREREKDEEARVYLELYGIPPELEEEQYIQQMNEEEL